MKMSYKKVILTGFAFMLISAFWQAYDPVVRLTLENRFHLSNAESGIIMALDNILAVFLLPLFGALSDKTTSRFGKRTPFIVFGGIASIIAMLVLPFMETLTGFIVCLLVLLLAMAVYRSPAVSLMPDVTVKPYRSKANAVINLMGTVGGAVALVLGMVYKTSEPGKTDFFPYLFAIAIVMLIGLYFFVRTVKENQWAKEMQEDTEKYFPDKEIAEQAKTNGKLTAGQLSSLIFLLLSVFFWFMGYNAVTSHYAVYAANVLEKDYNLTLIIAQVSALIAFIPIGLISSKTGRKKTILVGVFILAASFLGARFITKDTPDFLMYIAFAFAGIGWATINVNSFPMVVELSKNGNVGRYTGYYYTASMAAQSITPFLGGLVWDKFGYEWLFPYAAICVAVSFLTMLLVFHGDSKPELPKNAVELLNSGEDMDVDELVKETAPAETEKPAEAKAETKQTAPSAKSEGMLVPYTMDENKMVFEPLDEKGVGMIWFVPENEFQKGVPCKGVGSERYPEGSVYTGDMSYDGTRFYKDGYGEQDFTKSTFATCASEKENLYKIIGHFPKDAWIRGNGILLYVNEKTKKPSSYDYGFLTGTEYSNKWLGEFNEELVPQGWEGKYRHTGFSVYKRRILNNLTYTKKTKGVKTLLIGDSWFGMWTYTDPVEATVVQGKQMLKGKVPRVNIGVGGTKYSDWLEHLPAICKQFAGTEKILVNLGFNDLHSGKSPETVYEDFLTFVSTVHECLPKARIYISAVCHVGRFPQCFENELKLNAMELKYCFEHSDFLTYLPADETLMKNGKPFPDIDDYCINDQIHLNDRGYAIWGTYLLEKIK